ncbi:MAG: hypothetical protein M1828_003500 [Chrysothrix sp. TS-e1954]|nr:MAG: hypothetical protein M1828_003500 [Chrysothrix sp. TS-e1954]
MDGADITDEVEQASSPEPQPRQLPDDLPKSLNDRKATRFDPGVEVYDAWQGSAQVLTAPVPSRSLDFDLSLEDGGYENGAEHTHTDHVAVRLDRMLAQQAAHREDGVEGADEEAIAKDKDMSDTNRKQILQKSLIMASSNGESERLGRLLEGSAKQYIDLNASDDDGTPPLIYAACFGHEDILATLSEVGADVDVQDAHKWTALMWATVNHHKNIVKILVERGASAEARSSSGRTAFEFAESHDDISEYLHDNGYMIGSAGMGGDFYNSGFSQDKFEEEMAENEMKRRMMMESATNLEVDLGNLGIDETPESPEEYEEKPGYEFVWERCLNDQMFIFQESEVQRIQDVIITNMTPQRSPSQKPVPANILFLGARYAHYHASAVMLEKWFGTAMVKINDTIERHQWDMTVLAFWISNTTLLLHYLRKDSGLRGVTTDYQLAIAELINDLFVSIIRDAERRMDKVFDVALLDHETIQGFEDVQFQNEWKLFRSKTKKEVEPLEKRLRPPSPKRRAKPSARNITSLLSSTLFVLDLYDVHSVIIAQVLAQLYYWLGTELFNRVLSSKKYLARTKAMQIRMNVSILEEWARNNNRQPEHYESGNTVPSGDSTMESARQHLGPVVQLMQWLQIFSELGDNIEALEKTVKQLPRLSPQQLIHAVKQYRPEVGERGLPKKSMAYLNGLQNDLVARKAKRRSMMPPAARQTTLNGQQEPERPSSSPGSPEDGYDNLDDELPENLMLDPSLMLPFSLPTSTDMLISYGAGFGGVNRDRERKYTPTVPPDFLAKLDTNGTRVSPLDPRMYEGGSPNETNDE